MVKMPSSLTSILLFFIAISIPLSGALVERKLDAVADSGEWGIYSTGGSGPGRIEQGAGTFLASGDPVNFTLLPASNPILLTGGYRVAAPSGATQLKISLQINTQDADVDLGVRFGQDLKLPLGSNVDFLSATPGQATEEVIITPASSPSLQEGIYFIGLVLRTTNQAVDCTITATITGGSPVGTGIKLTSDVSQGFSIPAVTTPGIAAGQSGFRVEVPNGSLQLRVDVNLDDPTARVRIFARHGFDIGIFNGTPVFDWNSAGSSSSETLIVTMSSIPALRSGTVFIGFSLDSVDTGFAGTIKATTSTVDAPTLILSTSTMTFAANIGTNPEPKQFTVTNTGGGSLNYAITTTQPWITVTPGSGSSSGEVDTVDVSIDTAGLSPGNHFGPITVEQTDGPLIRTISLMLTITEAALPEIGVTPETISVDVPIGTTRTTSLEVQNTGGGILDFSIISHNAWLSVTPGLGMSAGAPQIIVVVVDAAGLGAGIHDGRLTVRDNVQSAEKSIAVTANVAFLEPSVELTLDSLTFEAESEGTDPPAQLFSVRNSGVGTLNYSISASEPWISISPTMGAIGNELQEHSVMVSKAELGTGVHSGRITVERTGSAGLSKAAALKEQTVTATIDVTLAITESVIRPNVPENAVLNAASFLQAPTAGHELAPGSIISIFGTNFGTGVAVGTDLPLATSLDGIGVTFDGIAAPLFFVGTTQINAQLPFGLMNSTAELVVTGPGGGSDARQVPVATFSPGFFTFSQSGSGQVIATYAAVSTIDPSEIGALVAPLGLTANSRPARAGDVITLWLNGLGPVTPPIENGRNSFDPGGFQLRNTQSRPTVRLGGGNVPDGNVLFSGLAPEFVGLYQINMIVPPGFPFGDATPIQVIMGGVTSRADATIALQ